MHGCKVQSALSTTVSCISSLHAYSYIQQSGRIVKTMNAKNMKKSLNHEKVDANITCDFGDSDISRFRIRLPQSHTHIVSSIISRCYLASPGKYIYTITVQFNLKSTTHYLIIYHFRLAITKWQAWTCLHLIMGYSIANSFQSNCVILCVLNLQS